MKTAIQTEEMCRLIRVYARQMYNILLATPSGQILIDVTCCNCTKWLFLKTNKKYQISGVE